MKLHLTPFQISELREEIAHNEYEPTGSLGGLIKIAELLESDPDPDFTPEQIQLIHRQADDMVDKVDGGWMDDEPLTAGRIARSMRAVMTKVERLTVK